MADTAERTEDRVSREATDWLILLQEEPDDPDLRRRFEAWRRASPAHAAAWEATRHAAGVIDGAPPAHAHRWGPFVADMCAVGTSAVPKPSRAVGRRRVLQAAALALAACLALLFVPDLVLRLRADFMTGTAETRTIRLDDDSTVVLAPDSAVTVVYGAGERRVRLLAGEAFFEVTPDPARPFHVDLQDVRATVLGTSFDVRRDGDGAVVAVAHGRVRVDDPTASPPVSETLEAGQAVRVAWSGGVVRRPAVPVGAWRDGRLIAQDEPMGGVVDQLRRYYAGTIVLTGGTLSDLPVTGVYNLDDPVDALRAIARAHRATVHEVTPWILIVTGP